ncbi:MAG: motility protein A [Proteobacteria bacterium]|nr:MAG: motility protein A [Pseudomonadota bacterium]
MRSAAAVYFGNRDIDRSAVFGLLMCLALLAVGMLAGGKVFNFLDLRSFLLVVGGTFGATLIHCSLSDLANAWLVFRNVWVAASLEPQERIRDLVHLSKRVRANGTLTLEREAQMCSDTFMSKGLELTADGQPEDDIRRILETDLRASGEQAARAIAVFETLGSYAPALGLIGTLMGLVEMLGELQNPAAIGPAMSLALITTLYGAVLANLVFLPIAGKLRLQASEESTVRTLTIEGILSLRREENPIILEQRLQSFIPNPLNSGIGR